VPGRPRATGPDSRRDGSAPLQWPGPSPPWPRSTLLTYRAELRRWGRGYQLQAQFPGFLSLAERCLDQPAGGSWTYSVPSSLTCVLSAKLNTSSTLTASQPTRRVAPLRLPGGQEVASRPCRCAERQGEPKKILVLSARLGALKAGSGAADLLPDGVGGGGRPSVPGRLRSPARSRRAAASRRRRLLRSALLRSRHGSDSLRSRPPCGLSRRGGRAASCWARRFFLARGASWQIGPAPAGGHPSEKKGNPLTNGSRLRSSLPQIRF
jgi:hypothetical protein